MILTQELWEVMQQHQQHPQSTLQGMEVMSGNNGNGKTAGEELSHHTSLLFLATEDRRCIATLERCRAKSAVFLFKHWH